MIARSVAARSTMRPTSRIASPATGRRARRNSWITANACSGPGAASARRSRSSAALPKTSVRDARRSVSADTGPARNGRKPPGRNLTPEDTRPRPSSRRTKRPVKTAGDRGARALDHELNRRMREDFAHGRRCEVPGDRPEVFDERREIVVRPVAAVSRTGGGHSLVQDSTRIDELGTEHVGFVQYRALPGAP